MKFKLIYIFFFFIFIYIYVSSERLYQEITNRRRDARKREQAKIIEKNQAGAPSV